MIIPHNSYHNDYAKLSLSMFSIFATEATAIRQNLRKRVVDSVK